MYCVTLVAKCGNDLSARDHFIIIRSYGENVREGEIEKEREININEKKIGERGEREIREREQDALQEIKKKLISEL